MRLDGRSLWWHLFRVCARFQRPDITAWLFFRTLSLIPIPGAGEGDGIRILLFSKDGLFEDIMSSFQNEYKCDIYCMDVVNNKALKAISSVFLPPYIDDCNYISEKGEAIEGKKRYRAFLRSFWTCLQRRIHVDVVLSANFAYYAERELSAVLEEFGTPFIVLHKENLKSPGRVDFFHRVYSERRGPFFGRKILVYNTIERDLQIAAGAVTPDRVVVTGMPRLDRMHRWRRKAVECGEAVGRNPRQVLFFAFDVKTGLPALPRKTGAGFQGGRESLGEDMDGLSWKNLVRECHRVIRRFAEMHPDVRVIVKAKRNLPPSSPIYDIVGRGGAALPNLEVVVGGDPFDMIIRSSVVVGFNTTALFEALAAGIPVVVPWFEEALDGRMRPYIVDMQQAVFYARSSDELMDRLAAVAEETPCPAQALSPEVKELLETWVGNADGLAGRRVVDCLLGEISTRRPREDR